VEIRQQEGWLYVLIGFGLIFFGMLIDITDNFPSLNHYIIIGETKYQAFLEKVVGYLLGFILLAVGFWKWMPTIIKLRIAERELKKSHDELELRIDERTVELREEITERKQAEEKLRDSEHKLRVSEKELKSVINNTPDIIYRLDSNGNILFVNQSVKEYGYSTEELIGKNILELVHPDDREKAIYRMNERRTGDRRTKSFEIRLLTKDLTTVPFETRARGFGSFLINAEGIYSTEKPNRDSFEGTQGIARDISERKETEKALQKNEERYRSLYNSTPAMLHSIDPDGRIVSVSDRWLEIMGYDRSEVFGRKSVEFFTEASQQYAEELIIPEFFKTGHVEDVSYQFVKKNGETIDVLLTAISEKDENGNVIRSLTVSTDVTERMRVEEEREKLISELQTALAEIKTLRSILPLCSFCKKIRDDKGYWERVDVYIYKYLEADISHSICPECAEKHYPDLDI
jgi:PAS domain S-box-containing protein